jgi:hypothetical protein
MRKKKKTLMKIDENGWGIKGNGNWFKGIFARRFQLSRKKNNSARNRNSNIGRSKNAIYWK